MDSYFNHVFILLSSCAKKFPMMWSKKVVTEKYYFSRQGRCCIDLYKDLNNMKKQAKKKCREEYVQAKGIENKA